MPTNVVVSLAARPKSRFHRLSARCAQLACFALALGCARAPWPVAIAQANDPSPALPAAVAPAAGLPGAPAPTQSLREVAAAAAGRTRPAPGTDAAGGGGQAGPLTSAQPAAAVPAELSLAQNGADRAVGTGEPTSRAGSVGHAAATNGARGPADFAVIGDFGDDGPAEEAVARLVASWSPHTIVTTGDNNYRHGKMSTFDQNIAKYYAKWIAFGPKYSGRFRQEGLHNEPSRFFAALGNHDWHQAGAKDHLDALAPPGNGRYFVVDRGSYAFFFIDSNMQPATKYGLHDADVQAAWLKEQLAKSTAKAKVVVFHHPPYSLGPHPSSTWMQWPFKEWGAHLVLSGHNHLYERHVVGGLPYVVNGFGGTGANDVGGACEMAGSALDVCVSNTFGAMRGQVLPRADAPSSKELVFETFLIDGRRIDRFAVPL